MTNQIDPLDPEAVYLAQRADGTSEVARVAPTYSDEDGTLLSLTLYSNNRARDITPLVRTKAKGGGMIFTAPRAGEGVIYTLTPLKLGDERIVWPTGQKTFNDLDALTAFAQKAIDLADSYRTNVDPEQSLAFTVDDKGKVLELIMDDADGDLYYRDNGDWAKVGSGTDYPTIFDRETVEVDPDNADEALQFWDDHQSDDGDIEAEQIYPFAKMFQ
jgi:hypothetical protein